MISRILTAWRHGLERHWTAKKWRTSGAPVAVNEVLALPAHDRYHAKQGRSTGRWTFGTSERPLRVFIKRHHRLPWLTWLAAALWPEAAWSPAWREYRNLEWAKGRGIAVPEPLAVGECLGPGLSLRSYLAIEELIGMTPLHEAVGLAQATLPETAFTRWKRSCLRAVARSVSLLHAQHRFHKDLYLCHFFVPTPAAVSGAVSPDTVYLIDLHRMARHRLLGWYFRVKDLAQLLYSSWQVPGITDRDRLRFLRAYGGGRVNRWLLAAVNLKAKRYARHNRGPRGFRAQPLIRKNPRFHEVRSA